MFGDSTTVKGSTWSSWDDGKTDLVDEIHGDESLIGSRVHECNGGDGVDSHWSPEIRSVERSMSGIRHGVDGWDNVFIDHCRVKGNWSMHSSDSAIVDHALSNGELNVSDHLWRILPTIGDVIFTTWTMGKQDRRMAEMIHSSLDMDSPIIRRSVWFCEFSSENARHVEIVEVQSLVEVQKETDRR